MTFETICVTLEEPIATIQIHRPKVLNALNRQTMDEIVAALDRFETDDAVRVVILTGDERAFAAGADIQEFRGAGPVRMLLEYRFQQWARIRAFPKPLVAAVSGYCLGGGCELAMACDIILAAENARFGQPEVNLGLMPGAGGTQRLVRAIGKHRAMELVLTGRHITAQQAYEWGLVNRVVPTEMLMDEARALAREIAAKPPIAVRCIKEAILMALETPLSVGLEYERKLFYLLFATEDKEEGIEAFLTKRAPAFRGR
jgi:enoyl-CoA hydratase